MKSVSILASSPEPHLPSYLSLACTVNGYSPITNYDPERLSKSRDASPHRLPEHDYLTATTTPTHRVQRNLLSPPNLINLSTVSVQQQQQQPTKSMSEQTMEHHKQIYSTTETLRVVSREVHSFTKTMTASASTENGIHNSKFIKHEAELVSSNGQCSSESLVQEFLSTKESKSFIQQRVERLYGPCALAQGFFVTKRQKSRHSESNSDKDLNISTDDKPSKSVCDKFGENETGGDALASMKQSSSSPALPVLRHLRPEFRAQLPIIKTRKSGDGSMAKSSSEPKIADEAKVVSQRECNVTPEQAVIPGNDVVNNINKNASPGKFGIIHVNHFSQLLAGTNQGGQKFPKAFVPIYFVMKPLYYKVEHK